MEKIKIQLKNSTLVLSVNLFDSELDVDRVLQIDMQNLMGELVFFPVIYNKIGLLSADAQRLVAEAKLDLEIWEAKYGEKFKKDATLAGEKVTVKDIETAVVSNKDYKVKKDAVAEAIKSEDYIKSIYWAAKEKQENLKLLAHGVKVGDVDDHIIIKSLTAMYGIAQAKKRGNLID